MSQLINFWVNLVTSLDKPIDAIPEKIKSAVIGELVNVGFVTEKDIADVKDAKIAEMSAACNKTIEDGFDIVLSDGYSHHFSLEISDQLKISKLNDRANAGIEELPYHADGESCKFYSSEDVAAINTQMENNIEFHVTYFNSLRDYINSMQSITDVQNVHYGTEIPAEYQSEVLVALYEQMRDK